MTVRCRRAPWAKVPTEILRADACAQPTDFSLWQATIEKEGMKRNATALFRSHQSLALIVVGKKVYKVRADKGMEYAFREVA